MTLIEVILLFTAAAILVQLTRSWTRLASVVIALSTPVLILSVVRSPAGPLDLFGVTLTLEAAARDFAVAGLILTAALALATVLMRDRVSLGFLYWSWVPWFIALTVNDFAVALFAWAIGFVVPVFGMKPRKFQRSSGAAYYLVVVVLATSFLLLASRFTVLYPLTPERIYLIQFAVLFLSLGFGLLFALVPFQFWVGPMTDDAPLPTAAAILALAQPIGLVLLFRFLNQNLWLSDKSNIFELMALAGPAAVIVGGMMAAVERRAGRIIGYAAVFTFGFALLDLARASPEGLVYSTLELLSRALGLTVMACAVTIGRETENLAVRRLAQAATVLGGLSLVGLRLGVGLSERWNALLQIAGTDQRLFVLFLFAHAGLLVGVVRFAGKWYLEGSSEPLRTCERTLPVKGESIIQNESVVQTAGEPSEAFEAGIIAANSRGSAGMTGGEKPGPGGMREEGSKSADVSAKTGDGTEKQGEKNEERSREADDYVFEDHLREIARTVMERSRPHFRRLAKSLPSGTMGLLVRVWSSWQVWTSVALLVALIGMLLIVGFLPGALFERAVASLGQPPLVQ